MKQRNSSAGRLSVARRCWRQLGSQRHPRARRSWGYIRLSILAAQTRLRPSRTTPFPDASARPTPAPTESSTGTHDVRRQGRRDRLARLGGAPRSRCRSGHRTSLHAARRADRFRPIRRAPTSSGSRPVGPRAASCGPRRVGNTGCCSRSSSTRPSATSDSTESRPRTSKSGTTHAPPDVRPSGSSPKAFFAPSSPTPPPRGRTR